MKLLATFFNTVAAGSLAGAVIVPAVNAAPGQRIAVHWTWIPAAMILHRCGQSAYRLLRSEDQAMDIIFNQVTYLALGVGGAGLLVAWIMSKLIDRQQDINDPHV